MNRRAGWAIFRKVVGCHRVRRAIPRGGTFGTHYLSALVRLFIGGGRNLSGHADQERACLRTHGGCRLPSSGFWPCSPFPNVSPALQGSVFSSRGWIGLLQGELSRPSAKLLGFSRILEAQMLLWCMEQRVRLGIFFRHPGNALVVRGGDIPTILFRAIFEGGG